MRLELTQQIGIKQKLSYLLDVFIDLIVELRDVVVFQHITLSEVVLFGLAFFRAIWFSIFGVENANYSFVFPDAVWIALFWAVSSLHALGFARRSFRLRIASAYAYTGIWGFLMVIAALSGTNAPAVPTLFILSIFSFALIIRLSREHKKNEC